MGNINRIILAFIIGLIPFLSKSQSDPDWPRFELYQLVQGTDSGQFVITAQDSNLVFTDLLKMRFFPDTALIFNGDTIAVKGSLLNYVSRVELGDTASAIRLSIPLIIGDSLVNYATKVQLTDTASAIRLSIPLIVSDTASVLRALIATKGTVSSVAATGTNGISVTGSPITTSGTLTVTSNATTLNTQNTIVLRDGSGNFKAGVIEANLAGIANQTVSSLTPGYGLTPSDVFNGFLARTFNVDTSKLATLTAVADTATSIRSAITAGVTGTFINGAVPYAASAGSALTNSGWSIYNGSLLRGYGTTSFNFDAVGTIGGTSITASAAVNGQTAAFTRGAQFNSEIGNYDFVIGGNGLATLFRTKGSTNRVGINYGTDPGYTLDVNGDINVSSGSVFRINGTALTGSQWVNSGSDIYYNSGEVGIGNTNPTSTLHVTGTANITDDLVVDNFTFFVDASENSVGIGTNEPISNLDVRGTANFDLGTLFVQPTDNYVGVRTGNPSAALDVRGDAIFNNDGGDFDFRIKGDNDANLFFVDAGTDRIGIGTNTPEVKFNVNGTLQAGNVRLFSITDDAYVRNVSTGDLLLETSTNSIMILKTDGSVILDDYGGSGDQELGVNNNGKIIFYSGSDGRLKNIVNKNIKGLEAIMQLKPVEYKWKQNTPNYNGLNEIGFIAQDVKKAIPLAVPYKEDEVKMLGIKDRAIIATLVKAVQEQQIQIEQLKAELKNVKKKVKTD